MNTDKLLKYSRVDSPAGLGTIINCLEATVNDIEYCSYVVRLDKPTKKYAAPNAVFTRGHLDTIEEWELDFADT